MLEKIPVGWTEEIVEWSAEGGLRAGLIMVQRGRAADTLVLGREARLSRDSDED